MSWPRDPELAAALAELRLERERMAEAMRAERHRALPYVVEQALSDVALPSACRLLMWHLSRRLDTEKYREQNIESLAAETRFHKSTVGDALARLVADGYLSVRGTERRARAYRLPVSRAVTREFDAA